MSSKQTMVVLCIILLMLIAWLSFPLIRANREPAPAIAQGPYSFDASNAYQVTQEFVTQFPRRVLGSLESRQSSGYLQERLGKLGYKISYGHFDARIGGRKEVGRNILAFKQGQTPDILALVAHYDTAKTTFQGAMDNGSGVGVLLELARVFAGSQTHRSLLFILSDGEEWGMLGARDIATSYPEQNRIMAVLSLDHVSVGDLSAITIGETGQFSGFSPPWMRRMIRKAAEKQGLPLQVPSRYQEYLEKALLISWSDQGPFLGAGIPAINLGSESTDLALEKAVYHSAQDTVDKLKISSIEGYGLVAESVLRTLDGLPEIPRLPPISFRASGSVFASPKAIGLLHYLAFLPIPLSLFFLWRNRSRSVSLPRIGREILAYLGTILPFLIAYFFIGLLRALRLFPLYSLYPAPPKDPVLENPSWGVLAAILGAGLIAAVICYFAVRFSNRGMPRPDFHVSKLVLLGLMAILAAFALRYNSYWAAIFLVLPAWIWVLAGYGRNIRERVIIAFGIVAAGIPYYLFLWIYASRLQVGWKLIWYQVLALNTGTFTIAGYFLGVAAAALGIRFLVIQFFQSGPNS